MKYLILGKGINGEGIKRVLEHLNIAYDFLETDEVTKFDYDLVIKSPGIPISLSIIKEFTLRNIEVITDIELCYRFFKRYYIAITGTNGKTSTTKMVAELLAKKYPAVACGNIGYTISDAILDHSNDTFFVVELSSFQLNNCKDFKPDIAAILNLKRAHQDFHGSLENYYQAKLKIIQNANNKTAVVYHKDDQEISKRLTEDIEKMPFSKEDKSAKCYLKRNNICFGNTKIFSAKILKKDSSIVLENVLAATAIAYHLGIDKKDIKAYFKEYKGIPHRIEKLSERIFNDAKSTNVASTKIALGKMKRPVLLLCGGKNREEDLNELKPVLNKIKKAYSYGETSQLLKSYFEKNNISCQTYETLTEALKTIKVEKEAKDILLFSPMMASWDQFKNYEERGEIFKKFWS